MSTTNNNIKSLCFLFHPVIASLKEFPSNGNCKFKKLYFKKYRDKLGM